MAAKELAGELQRTGEEEVIRIEPAENLAGSHLKSGGKGIRLSFVLSAVPIGQLRLMAADDVDRAVDAAAVEDEVLEIGIALVENAAQRGLDEFALIERRRDDGDARPGFVAIHRA